MNITEVCIRRPILAWMLMLATVLFGVVAATRIGISQFPDVDEPNITVQVNWEGAAPEVMEHDVVEPIEEAVTQVEGIKSITSTSRQGSASVTLELELSRDVDVAMQEVQSKVAQAARRLPREIDPPTVSKNNPEDQPIMWVGLSGPFAPQELSDYARYRVKERLQRVPGVGEIQIGGSLERNVRIWLDAGLLDEHGITVTEVAAALRREHVELPAGRIETEGREINVRVLGEALDLETLRRLVVAEHPPPGGSPIRLEDVGLVEDGFEDVRRLTRVNGAPAQGLGIRKQRGSNAVAVADGVHAALDEIRETLPEGMQLGINFDSTRFIEQAVHHIELELVLAVILTALACWLFLGSFSSTLNVVLAIPMSLLGAVAAIYFLGFTLNTFTLLALSLAVGIVVDDAIMVLENIYRHFEEGADRVTAARSGTREITFAALAATVAVCAIFIPVVFMEGRVGRFFLQFGITLCIAVVLSYVEAITLAPSRCAQILERKDAERRGLGAFVERAFDGLARAYSWTLRRSLRHPVVVLIAATAIVAPLLVLLSRLPREFVPSQDQSRLMVRLQTAVGSDLSETLRAFEMAEEVVSRRDDVERMFGVVGGFGGNAAVNTANMFVTLVPPDEREQSQAEVQAELRRDLGGFPGVRAVVQDLSQSGFSSQRGFPVEFSVRGPEWEPLVAIAADLREKLQSSGMAVDVDSDYRIGMPELRIEPDRERAADLGVSVEDIAATLNTLVGGARIGKFSQEGRRIDVRMRLLAEQRSRPEDLARLRVRSSSGELVSLAQVTRQVEVPALQAITRRDRERAITITANVAPGHAQDEVLGYVETFAGDLPAGYQSVLSGASVEFRESMGALAFAFVLGIMVAYMVLASQFNSLIHPITVLTILPPSVAGAAVALWLSDFTLNIFSMIGLLLLMGIVKKNSIILVDYANQSRGRGAPTARDAMLEAGPVRLRPILMTTMATMMAAIPAALQLGAGSETRAPMAVAVIGGLVVSTAMSLLVVPAFYVVADRVTVHARAAFRRLRPHAGPEVLPAP